jgi:hypothetical protein
VGKFLAVFGAFVLLGMIAVYFGWFGVRSSTTVDGDHEKLELTMDKAKIRDDTSKVVDNVKELSRDATEGIKNVATKVGDGLSSNPKTVMTADRKTVELNPGTYGKVKFTRSGVDLAATRLTLTPTPASNLVVTGGQFALNETETFIVIDAPTGSTNGEVKVEGVGDSQIIKVVINNKL